MDIKEEEILGDQIRSHWYYKAKAAALLRDLGGWAPMEILDVGAGSGFFSRVLLQNTAAARATCVDIGYAGDRDETWCAKSIAFRRTIEKSDADLVLAMDVMEHVADETALMRPYIDLVASGTHFIISVPAFNFLWSAHDVFLEHHRRYTLDGLEGTLRKCGLYVDWSHYYYAGIFPLAASIRLWERFRPPSTSGARSQLKRHGPIVNGGMAALCAVERPIMRANKLFGLTVFAGCHKP